MDIGYRVINVGIIGGSDSSHGPSGEQIQSDWNQTNPSCVDYIKNKPQNLLYFEQ